MPKSKNLKVSRREWQRLLVESWGKEGEPGGNPWYSEGRYVQHLTPGIFIHISFCGRDTGRTSSEPIRTPIGITCPECTLVAKRIAKRIATESSTVAGGERPPLPVR